MNADLLRLAERRATLVVRAASQRQELARAVAPWRTPLATLDQGLRIVRYLRQYPALLAGAAAIVTVLRPRALFKWARRGWLAWGVLRGIKRRLDGR